MRDPAAVLPGDLDRIFSNLVPGHRLRLPQRPLRHVEAVRADAAGALGYLKDGRALEPLSRAFYEDTEWLVRFSAAVSLGNLQDIRAKQVLLKALDSSETVVQQAAIAALENRQKPIAWLWVA